jgi:hypothetical protein
MRDFHDMLREKQSSLLMLFAWSSMCIDFLMVYESGFLGRDTGVLQLDVMAKVYTAFSHS